jgi:hypothetical protein
MAADFVLEWQTVLREHLLPRHKNVNDLLLLEIATKFGGIDPYTNEPVHRHHRKPDSLTKKQIHAILDGLQNQIGSALIDPMTPIGPISATSISEPAYQGGMRTFHYAGVLTKKDPLALLNIEVGTIPNKNALVALALPADKRFDINYANKIKDGLTRSVLGDYCGIVKNHPAFRHLEMSQVMKEAEDRLNDFPEAQKYQVGQKYSPLLDATITTTGAATPEYQSVLDDYRSLKQLYTEAAIDAGKSDSYFIYLKTPEMLSGVLKQKLKQRELRIILNRQRKSANGMFRTIGDEDNPLHYLWRNATVEEQTVTIGDEEIEGVALTLPFLTSRLKMGFMETVLRLEFCNGFTPDGPCHSASTIAKMVHKAGRKGTSKVPVDDWDTDQPTTEYNASLVSSLLEEADIKQNPPMDDERLEQVQDEAVGLIEIDMSTSDRYDFEIAELGRIHRRCSNCHMGWYNVQTSVVQYNFGPKYEDYQDLIQPKDHLLGDYDYDHVGFLKDYKFEELNRQIDIAGHVGELKDDTVFPEDLDFVTYPGASRKGQNSDYPLAFLHGGRVVNDPVEDEYYILMNYKDVDDGRMNNFKGHFLTASLSEFLDFNRTTTSDMKQVEYVLGIEAARFQLAHNLFNAQGNGDTIAMAGNSSPVHYKHYLLLADSLCSGITASNARAGSASVSGVAANKGRRSEIVDGKIVSYSSVLAQAYERQTQVLLGAAPIGVVDDLSHPISAQISGQPERFGTLGGADSGKFADVPTLELFDLKNRLASAVSAVNSYSNEKIGRDWTNTPESIQAYLDDAGNDEFGLGALIKEMADEMYQDEQFLLLLDDWKLARKELFSLLNANDLAV